MNNIKNLQYTACFALTEIGHGTNAKGMQTTATYDPKTETFILHSPSFQAAKCWVGLLGKSSTHAIVYAQLLTSDGVNHGLHPFIVQVRDPNTMQAPPGVTVGDLGEKIGLNGVDNGFVVFNQYHIPRICLLNKTADVTPEGKYVAAIKDKNKRFGASLGALSNGRVNITMICYMYASMAIAIAVRYCSVRKQFGPSGGEEWPVIEYQVLQGRLMPQLAATYAMKIFSTKFSASCKQFTDELMSGENSDDLAMLGIEIHALSSATKPLCAWTARDIIQDCREACGGHGYLKFSRLGDIKQDHDANCTYEGENNVLVQQASNWLLNQWSMVLSGKKIASPLRSIEFLPEADNILNEKFNCLTVVETMKPENLMNCLRWLTCYYLKKTYEKTLELKREKNDDFFVRNNSQQFYAKTLSLVYGEHAIVQEFVEALKQPCFKYNERNVLSHLCSLYAASVIEKRLGDFYAGGYASPTNNMNILIRDGIIQISRYLSKEAVSLIDVIAPPDFILNSPLAMADGDIYRHLENAIIGNKENLSRPSWWKELFPSKL